MEEGLIQAKEAVVDIIYLLISRFAEFVKDYIMPFFEKIWDMIQYLPETKVFNGFVSSITEYLSISLRQSECKQKIKQDLEYLFSQFLVKHMTFTQDDFEEFEADEIAFIKMDLEEIDKETRRRSCFNLVKKLVAQFPSEVGNLVNQMQESFCDMYQKDAENNWEKQILVINFIIASTIENYTFERGATKINIDQDTLIAYLEKIIIPEINSDQPGKYPILFSQCIKFLIIYRNFLPQEWLPSILEKLTTFLVNESIVIRTYSACAIEKILNMRDLTNNQLILTKEQIRPTLEDLLKNLNILITESDGLDQYGLKSLFRVVTIAGEDFMPYSKHFVGVVGTFVDK